MRKKYYLDTEFNEQAPQLELISIGIVDADGRGFYAVSSQFDQDSCNDWVQQHVLSQLGKQAKQRLRDIRDDLLDFIGDDQPAFWGYCPAWDWVLFTWLWGGVGRTPKHFPGICRCVHQLALDNGLSTKAFPTPPSSAHNALSDAHWTKACHESVMEAIRKRK